jgi:predicted DNA-binding transcriptional regulator AlpA
MMNPTDPIPASADSGEPPVSTLAHLDPASTKQLLDLVRETLETTLAAAFARISALSLASPTPSPKSTGLDLKDGEKLKAADLRFALLTGKVPENSGLLIDTKTLARLLSISKAHLYRLQADEALLAPIQIGHVKRWRLTEVLEWIDAGCPPQNVWNAMRQSNSRRKGK